MKILNIEDSELDYELMLRHLKKSGLTDIYSERVETEEQLRVALAKEKWNIVISDYNVPGFSPLSALYIVRETSPNLPFIVVSGLVGEESVADMMKAGVEDFVIKSRLERLAPVIKRAMREYDIQEQELKARMIAKKALEAKEEMLAIVYHDIKNPLAAIQLDAQLLELLSYKEPSEDIMEDLRVQAKRILRTVDRLKVLVSDLLEHNKPLISEDFEHNFIIKKTLCNPLNVLNEVLDSYNPLIQDKNLSIKKIAVQRKRQAVFDKDRIYQVLSNLLSNALKFTPSGGDITIELEETDSGEHIFSITDSGPGLSPEYSEKIFEKYWTGGSGNGLGLYICKSIVEAHGGSIHVEPRQGEGAKFTFTLPYAEVTSSELSLLNKEHSDSSSSIEISDDSAKNIYIVDDDDDLREVMTWAMEKEGYRVFSYGNPKAALDDLGRKGRTPGLIILDYHMDRMTGKDFLRLKKLSVLEQVKDCPVLMVSAAPQIVRDTVDPQMYSEVLLKPLDLNKLISAVHKYL